MSSSRIQRWVGAGVGAAVLAGTTMAVSYYAFAQGTEREGQPRPERGQRPGQRPERGQFPGGPEGGQFPGGPGGPGFPGAPGGFAGGPGGPGGPGFGPPMGMGPGGGRQLTATPNGVYVLRGNTLYAFDARTLKLTGQAELPRPEFGPGGPMGPGGPGGPGFRPGGPGGPGGPGAPGGQRPPRRPEGESESSTGAPEVSAEDSAVSVLPQ